jgi:hypothetical protein
MADKKQKLIVEDLNEHVLSVLNLEALPDSQKALMLDKMANVVNQRLLVRVFSSVEEVLQKKLKEILDKGTEQELQVFIEKNVPEFLDWVPEEIMKLKTEMLDNLQN